MRRFSVVCVITWLMLLSIATCVAMGDSTNQGSPAFELVLVGDAPDVAGITELVPEEDREQVRSAAARAIAKTKMHGGDWEVSYSKNGKYRLEKTPIAGGPKDEIVFCETVLFDDAGREISRWPRMYKSVFVSNTGRNLVAAEMLWGTGFEFYDLDHAEPVKSYKRHIGDGQFSDDGKYFVALSAGVALFTAEGDLLWRKRIQGYGGTMVFISPDGGCVVVTDARPGREGKSAPPRREHGESKDLTPRILDYRNRGKVSPEEEPDQEPGSFKLPERQRVRPSRESPTPITAFSNGGDVLFEYDTHLYRIDEVTFTGDGRLFAVVGTNEFLVFESDSGALARRVAVGPSWDDIASVAFSPDERYLVVGVTRYPPELKGLTACRYELWDLQSGLNTRIEVDELGAPVFSKDSRYAVCQKESRPVFESGRQVGFAPGELQLLRVATNR